MLRFFSSEPKKGIDDSASFSNWLSCLLLLKFTIVCVCACVCADGDWIRLYQMVMKLLQDELLLNGGNYGNAVVFRKWRPPSLYCIGAVQFEYSGS